MPRCVAWVGTAVLALGSGGPPSLVTGGPPAPGVWWWMILAPIFLVLPPALLRPWGDAGCIKPVGPLCGFYPISMGFTSIGGAALR